MESIYELAGQLLDKHHEDWDAAIEEGVQMAIDDPEIFEEFTKPLLIRSIKDIIRNVGSARRSKIFNLVPTCQKGQSGESLQRNTYEKMRERMVAQENTIMELWLNKCKMKLKDAKRPDLAQEINMFNDNARWNDKRWMFLNEIYEGLKNGERVKDRFTRHQLEKIQLKVHKKIDLKYDRRVLDEEPEQAAA